MNRFAELAAALAETPDVVVHLGAGACDDHTTWKELQPEKIILVEADAEMAAKARARFDDAAEVKVITGAIAPSHGPRTLNVTNNRRFSSLLEPAGLLDIYPNIKISGQAEVDAMTLDQLCEQETLSKNTSNLLVAELQGLEHEVFSSLPAGTLQKFKWIIIRSGDGGLYSPGTGLPTADLREVMADAKFTLLAFAEDMPPFTSLLCIRNDEALLNAALGEDRELSERNEEIRRLNADHARQLSRHHEELRAVTEKLKLARLQNKELGTTIANRTGELERTHEQFEALAKERDQLTNANKAQAEKLAEMRQTMQVNNKQKLKAEIDLQDLQTQYKTAMQHQEQQNGLLCDLKEKIHQASEFYEKLNLKNLVSEDLNPDEGNSGSVAPGDADDVENQAQDDE